MMENNRTIEDIAYLIKQAKDKGENKPIIFLGAGASVSAGIPLVNKIIEDILELHKEKPSIKRLTDEQRKDYYKLMSALSAQERRSLFSDYINSESVKLNVTHIYLAQMLKEGLIDYILTVNFDDLMLKACALFNFIPPVYDVSILNDFTTTTFLEKSITYLHGQHHGQWLLNAEGELTKVKESVPKIFERICNNRTWIVVGYSGGDELVNEIARIGSFENELYWVGYNESPLADQVKKKLFSNSRTNAYHIKGHDSDSFFLKLHSELNLKTPEIFNKPFSFLQGMMNQVTDIKIEDNEHKNLFSHVKDRMEISKKQVTEAIEKIENRDDENELIQEIIEKVIKKDFSEKNALEIEEHIKNNNYLKVKKLLGYYYNDWGVKLFNIAKDKEDKSVFLDCFAKYSKAVELIPRDSNPYSNWGMALSTLANIEKSKPLFLESFEKYEQAAKADQNNENIYNAWGVALSSLAQIDFDNKIFTESFMKFDQASRLNPNNDSVFYNWGTALLNYGRENPNPKIYEESIEKFESAIDINSKNSASYNNLGSVLLDLGKLTSDKKIYFSSFEKYKIATELSPNDGSYFHNWGSALSNLALKEKNKTLFLESFEKYKKASELESDYYAIWEDWGIALANLGNIELEKKFFYESFEKYKKASELNTDNGHVFVNWSTALLNLSYLDTVNKEDVLNEAKDVSERAYNLIGQPYNLACAYALMNDKENALKYLGKSLEKGFITSDHIENDRDWDTFREDLSFKEMLKVKH